MRPTNIRHCVTPSEVFVDVDALNLITARGASSFDDVPPTGSGGVDVVQPTSVDEPISAASTATRENESDMSSSVRFPRATEGAHDVPLRRALHAAISRGDLGSSRPVTRADTGSPITGYSSARRVHRTSDVSRHAVLWHDVGVGDLLPRLVTRVADIGAREYLRGIAHAGGSVHLALVAPPASGAIHVLEVHAPGVDPVVLLAEPLGPPSAQGVPLRLRVREETSAAAPSASAIPAVPDLALDVPPRISKRPTEPAPPVSALPAPPDDDDNWLEHGSDYRTLGSINPLASFPSSDRMRAVAPFLLKLAETKDVAQFTSLVAPLGPQIQEQLVQGETGAVWRLCSTLDLIAREEGPRADVAKQVLALFRDPKVLAPLAEKVLDGTDDKDRSATRLVFRGGKRGAHFLYQARLKRGAPAQRERFVTLLQSMGGAAVPVLVKALDFLQERLAVAGAVEIAEDVLRAVPRASDDALAGLVELYARSNIPQLAEAARAALARVSPTDRVR